VKPVAMVDLAVIPIQIAERFFLDGAFVESVVW
jgi:hypothetical protein